MNSSNHSTASTAAKHRIGYHTLSENTVRAVQTNLIAWYDDNRRKLPWRGDSPPYGKETKQGSDKEDVETAAVSEPPKKRRRMMQSGSKDGKKQSKLSMFFKADKKQSKRKNGKSNMENKNKNDEKKNCKENNIVKENMCKSEQSELKQESESQLKDKKILISGYSVWVSEIMLQQTRVETVIDYYLKWMKHFPTIESLANATEDEVNDIWAGLGYYRRAKHLHLAAKELVSQYNEKNNDRNNDNSNSSSNNNIVLSKNVNDLLKMKGIGEYTAGAIASIAYNENVACVDGNIVRVLSRLVGISCYSSPPQKYHWDLANKLVKGCERTDKLNQSLMELGATICIPSKNSKTGIKSKPLCTKCPINKQCIAYKEQVNKQRPLIIDKEKDKEKEKEKQNKAKNEGEECKICLPLPIQDIEDIVAGIYPIKRGKAKIREQIVARGIVSCYNNKTKKIEYFLHKRGKNGLLANQWDFLCQILNEKMIENKNLNNKKRKEKDTKNKIIEKECQNLISKKLENMFCLTFDSNQDDDIEENGGKNIITYIGTSVHIFSHIRQISYVFNIVLNGGKPCQASLIEDKSVKRGTNVKNNQFQWLDQESMNKKELTTCVEKIWKTKRNHDVKQNDPFDKSCDNSKQQNKNRKSIVGKKRKRKDFDSV